MMEQYLTFPNQAAVQDRFAEALLLTLIEEGPRALAEPQNYDVRANVMWAATMALAGVVGCGVPQDWATHALGHELTAQHGLDHAQTLAVVLPPMMDLRREGKREKLLQYAARVWNLREGEEAARIDAAIAATRDFFERMQVKTRLADYGVGADSIDALIAKLVEHCGNTMGERGDVTPELCRKVLVAAL